MTTIKSTNLPAASVISQVLGNDGTGSTKRIGVADLATQMVASAPFQDALGSQKGAYTYIVATWLALSAISGSSNGVSAHIPATDTDTHVDPVSAAVVPNEGDYSWVAGVGWSRVGGNMITTAVGWRGGVDIVDPTGYRLASILPDRIRHPEIDAIRAAVRRPYLGLVGGRCRSHYHFDPGIDTWGGRLGFVMQDDCSEIRVIWPNWYTTGYGGEVATGGTLTMTASIEQGGGFLQATFPDNGGGTTGTVGPGGNIMAVIAGKFRRGYRYFVNFWGSNSAGMSYVGDPAVPFALHDRGDYFQYGWAGVPDLTMAGGWTNTDVSQGAMTSPIAIVGKTSRPSIGVIGDSWEQGVQEADMDGYGDRGIATRALGRTHAITNLSQGAETAATFLAGGSRRAAVVQKYCSHVVVEYGRNDQGAGAGPIADRLAAIYMLFPAQQVIAETIQPGTTSSDGWSSVGGQTLDARNTERIAVNTWIRGLPFPLVAVIDVSDVVETAWNSGLYVPGTTNDGNHLNSHGSSLVMRSGIFDPAMIFGGGL